MPPLVEGAFWGGHLTDAGLFALAAGALALCVIWFGIAAWRHRRNLRAVPLRIHVAGTRGKTTTTRLIAAGLRAGGQRVLAKTTGALPRLILPDGSEEPWPRTGPPAVREQARFMGRAAALRADAVVLECMAIRPELIWASEEHLVQATTAVITNARPDHFEDIGEAPDAAAESLAWVVPRGGRLFVAAEGMAPIIGDRAAARGATLATVDTTGLDPIASDRALALSVCAAHGVPVEVALPAMDRAGPDPGAFFARPIAVGPKRLRFANAFACNDTESLALLWNDRGNCHDCSRPVVLLNARRDRPLRTRRFLDFLAAQVPPPLLFLTGDPLAFRLAREAGFPAVRRLRARGPEAALGELAAVAAPGATIWGIGNFEGLGARLVAALAAGEAAC